MPQISSLKDRLREHRGVSIALLGPSGVGKTTQLGRLASPNLLYGNIEDGDIALHDKPMSQVQLRSHPEMRDFIVQAAGPNPSFSGSEPYSLSHFESRGGYFPDRERFEIYAFDSVTAWARDAFRWALEQPEVFTERGKRDLRNVYGLLGREVSLGITHLHRNLRDKILIFVAALETITDEFGHTEHRVQAPGQQISRELLSIVDVVTTMTLIDFGDGKPIRAFICGPNIWKYPGKDRSGRLDVVEPPDLKLLIAKILPARASHGSPLSAVPQSTVIPTTTSEEGA